MISESSLVSYIENLNLRKNYECFDTNYIIDNNYIICIESSTNVFFIDKKMNSNRDLYTFIINIERLKDIYYKKTGKNIEILMRKEKLKKLEECSR